MSWGGGSAGGSDQILAGLIAKQLKIEPSKINYVATAGGGELMSSILGGHITLAMGGYNEFAPQIQSGKLRALAVSSPERLPGRRDPDAEGTGRRSGIRQLARDLRPGGIKASEKSSSTR